MRKKKHVEENIFLMPISFQTAMLVIILVAGVFSTWIGGEASMVRNEVAASAWRSVPSASSRGVYALGGSASIASAFLASLPPSRQRIVAEDSDYMITDDHAVVKDTTIETGKSVVIKASDVTLENVRVVCVDDRETHAAHSADGIMAVGVDRLTLHNVSVSGCGGNGIFLKDGRGHDLLEGVVSDAGKTGIVLDNVHHADIAGYIVETSDAGVSFRNESHDNRIIASSFYDIGTGNSIFVSENSSQNQIVRNKSTNQQANVTAVVDLNPGNMWHHNVCGSASGFAACVSDGAVANNYGDPSSFSPQSFTVCDAQSFGGNACDYSGVAEGVDAAGSGDLVIVDSAPSSSSGLWPMIIIDKPMWLLGNTRSEDDVFGSTVVVGDVRVTAASGVRLENVYINQSVDDVLSRTEGAELINVKARSGDSWVDVTR